MSFKRFLSIIITIAGVNAHAQHNSDSSSHLHLIVNSNLILSNATLTNNTQIGLEYALNKRHSVLFTYLIPYNRKDTCDDIIDFGLELGYTYRMSKENRKNPLYLKLSMLQLRGEIFYCMLEPSPGDCIYKRNASNATIFSMGISKQYQINKRMYLGGEYLIGGRYSFEQMDSGKLFLNMMALLQLKYQLL